MLNDRSNSGPTSIRLFRQISRQHIRTSPSVAVMHCFAVAFCSFERRGVTRRRSRISARPEKTTKSMGYEE